MKTEVLRKSKKIVIYSQGLRVLLEKHLMLPGSVSVGVLRGCMFCEVESYFFCSFTSYLKAHIMHHKMKHVGSFLADVYRARVSRGS